MKKSRYEAIERLTIADTIVKEELRDKNTVLVSCELCVPRCSQKLWMGAKRFNGFYREMAEKRLRYARSTLLRRAKKRHALCPEENSPFTPSRMELTYSLRRNGGGYITVCYDVRVREGTEPADIVRYTDTWSFATGYPAVAPIPAGERRRVLKHCRKELEMREAKRPGMFFPGVKALLRREFRAEQCYLGEKGPGVFYQLSTLAPRDEGFIEFENVLPSCAD